MAAASAARCQEEDEKWEPQLGPGGEGHVAAARASCMATIPTVNPERNVLARDEAAAGWESSRKSPWLECREGEAHLGMPCKT